MKDHINKLIEEYAQIYSKFELLQKRDEEDNQGMLPAGDQKTGVIGEYYAKCYIESLPKAIESKYAKPGESFDLEYRLEGMSDIIKVQVKCVSAHSKTRTIAPLNLSKNEKGEIPFHFLYLIALDKAFLPIGFYINSYDKIISSVDPKKKKISGLKMKSDNSPGSQGILDFSINKNDTLLKILNH